MKKIYLITTIFLIGINATAKTFEVNKSASIFTTENNTNTIEVISFIQEDILYKISTTGTFSFEIVNGNNHFNNVTTKGKKRKVRRNKSKGKLPKITKDDHGNIIKIGEISIFYKDNGKVKQIDNIPLVYNRGWLIQIGGFDIFYNSNKRIYDITGSINDNNMPTYINGVVWNKTQWNGYNIPTL